MKCQVFACVVVICGAMVSLSGCNSMGSGYLNSSLPSPFDSSSTQSTIQPVDYESLPAGMSGLDNGIELTPANTRVEFTGTAGPMKKSGHFKRISGNFVAPTSSQPGAIEVTIDMDSLATDNWLLTKHLKSGDFFNVKQHSTSRFVSNSIRKTQLPNQYAVTGELTIHGVTRSIETPAKLIAQPNGTELQMDFTILQTDFGMERGAKKTKNEVPISLTAQVPAIR